MEQWYYTKGGQQQGPVGLEEMRELVANGTIDRTNDFVWNPSMTDWLPASEVPVVSGVDSPRAPAVAAPSGLEPTQPFAYQTATGAIEEIVPGSEPIIPTACLKRAFDLTVKNIGPLLAIVLIWIAIAIAVSLVFSVIGSAFGYAGNSNSFNTSFGKPATEQELTAGLFIFSVVSQIIQSLVNVFLTLGAARIGLNIVSGKPFDIGMLFGEGDKLIRAFFAQILFGLMVLVGLLLLIVPGIYIALRYGMYLNAIVDKNMGIMDSFTYSSRITENNRMNLFVIALLTILVFVAGCAAFIVGILFAYPLIAITWIVAYRWMQYGGRAVLDDPQTQQPLLSQLPD